MSSSPPEKLNVRSIARTVRQRSRPPCAAMTEPSRSAMSVTLSFFHSREATRQYSPVDLNRALAAHLIQRVEFVFRQRHRRGRDILDEVGHFGGSRDRQNDWRSRQKPCQRDLRRRRVLLRCHAAKRTIGAGELTSC